MGNIITVVKVSLMLSVLWLIGCGAEPNIQFESDSYSIRAGESITLDWDVMIDDDIDQAVSHVVSITSIGDVASVDAMTLSPEISTTYTLTDSRTLSDGEEKIIIKEFTVHVDLLLADWEPKDRNFENCVKEQNETRVYALDVDDVDCLYVSSLEGVQYLGGLKELMIRRGFLSDISQIKTLTELSTLGFISVPIRDLEPLENLTSLFALIVVDTAVTDVSPIGQLNDVVGVWLGMNNITDGLSELEPLLAQMSVYGGWIDLRMSVIAVPDTNKRIDCDYVDAFRAQTLYGDRVYWPEYCEL